MKKKNIQTINRKIILAFAFLFCFSHTSCTDDFYLSEKEVAAYSVIFSNGQNAQMYFDNLQGQMLEVNFDNSTGTPRISNTNLLTLMRSTELLFIEQGTSQISLNRLNAELQKQFDDWFTNSLKFYGEAGGSDTAKLTSLNFVRVRFLNNPTFTFNQTRQSISFDMRLEIGINGTVQVSGVNWFLDFLFGGINGTYPLQISMNNFRLQGEAVLSAPFEDASKINFKITPQPGTILVTDSTNTVAPAQVKNGLRDLLAKSLNRPAQGNFFQKYSYFALSKMRLTDNKLETSYMARPESARPVVHVVSRASDGKLYHARKNVSVWSTFDVLNFPNLTSRIDNDPTLISSGADQLELVATTANGSFVYAHFRNEAWGNWQTIAPPNSASTSGYKGKPALIASAPGQVEAIVEGRNGGLWHLRRLNGAWSSPVAVPLSAYPLVSFPVRDPVAVQSGNKLVIAFADNSNRLHLIAYDMETNFWGQDNPVLTQQLTQQIISYAPAIAASGDGRVDVVYVATSGTPSHRVFTINAANFTANGTTTGMSSGPDMSISGTLNATPVLICSGYRQLELIARGTDNRLYHKHYVSPSQGQRTVDGRTINTGWQSNWEGLNGNYFGSVTLSGERFNEYAAVSTPTGKIEFTGRVSASLLDNNAQQYLFHNEYDSVRFARDVWKTVQWRGYEQISAQRFAGRPSIATLDQNAEMAFAGNGTNLGPTIHSSRIDENNSTNVLMFSPPVMKSSPNPIDPVVLSSGAGVVDYLYLDSSNVIKHSRSWNFGGGTGASLIMPAGVTSWSNLSAVSYGSGFMDLIATGSNRFYHWRYRNGTWSSFVQLSGSIISQPILTYTGAGRLELFALGGDQKLYRWQYINGGWSNWSQITSSFTINANYFTSQSASSYGDGMVDLVVVNSQTGALYHRRIGGAADEPCSGFNCPPLRSFNQIGGVLTDAPVLSALSPTSLHVFAIGTDRVTYSNWASPGGGLVQAGADPPLRWSGYSNISEPNLLLGNAVVMGGKRINIVAVNQQGKLLINRYSNGAWTGFQILVGPTPSMQFNAPRYRPALAANGS